MSKLAVPHDAHEWISPPVTDAKPVAGYDAWLAQDIAAGMADLDAGETTSLANMRKEFGIE